MRIVHRDICKGTGSIGLVAESTEDLWHIYNLATSGDQVTATTFRKVVTTSTTSTTSEKKKLTVTLRITDPPELQEESLRIKGVNVRENKYLKLGASHTVELILQKKFTLHKELWDSIHLERLKTASDPSQSAAMAAVLIQPGFGQILLIGEHSTTTLSTITKSIPGKRLGSSTEHDKALRKFFVLLYESIVRHLNWERLECIVVASPGFVKDQFWEYLWSEASVSQDRTLLDNKKKFMLAAISSAHRHALKEILSDPSVMSKVEDTKAGRNIEALDQFFKMLHSNPDRAYYGYKHVVMAAENDAIETLLVTDDLFRAADTATRKNYVALVDQVKESGSDVCIFSALHTSGERNRCSINLS